MFNFNNERGSVVVIFLALFMVIALFLFSVYRFTTVDYQVVSKSFEDIKDRTQTHNVIELIKPYLAKDIMGEPDIEILENINVEELKDFRNKFENIQEIEVKNFITHLNGVIDFGTDEDYEKRCNISFSEIPGVSGVDDIPILEKFFEPCNVDIIVEQLTNELVENYVSSLGFADAERVRHFVKTYRVIYNMKEFREEDLKLFDYKFRADERKGWKELDGDTTKWVFEDFNNYTEVINEYEFGEADGDYGVIRTYLIEDNWLNNTIEDDSVYQEINNAGALVLPDVIYLRLKFDPKVHMITLTMGNEFETSEYEILNRAFGSTEEEDLYFLIEISENIPPTVDFIEISTDGETLGGTTFSILTGRELLIDVNRKELPNQDTITARREIITVEMKKGIYKVSIGSKGRGGE